MMCTISSFRNEWMDMQAGERRQVKEVSMLATTGFKTTTTAREEEKKKRSLGVNN
jgi:hypothetical protein